MDYCIYLYFNTYKYTHSTFLNIVNGKVWGETNIYIENYFLKTPHELAEYKSREQTEYNIFVIHISLFILFPKYLLCWICLF